jgi:hypothetical protein
MIWAQRLTSAFENSFCKQFMSNTKNWIIVPEKWVLTGLEGTVGYPKKIKHVLLCAFLPASITIREDLESAFSKWLYEAAPRQHFLLNDLRNIPAVRFTPSFHIP